MVMAGTERARIATEVMDPLTATALAIEGQGGQAGKGGNQAVILISCDLRSITANLRDGVREVLKKSLPEVASEGIILNATHTHNAPPSGYYGVDFNASGEEEFLALAIPRIAAAAVDAWKSRRPGGISFGLTYAVAGHNRLIASSNGTSKMYGKTNDPEFSHVEGYEDHSINLMYTWTPEKELTGVVVNVSVPSQVSVKVPKISADYWHETRIELRSRLGEKLFVLPQCGSAGDQSPRVLVDQRAEARMEQLTGRDRRQTVAVRIADASASLLPVMKENIEWNPVISRRSEIVPLPRRLISEKDIEGASEIVEKSKREYEAIVRKIEENPNDKELPDLRQTAASAYRSIRYYGKVRERFEQQKKDPSFPAELHVLRIGEMAIATNPFELYLDFGLQIKARSRAVQTFVVQLAGRGTYVPTARSVAGGAYGATPTSTEIGPEGGQVLVNWTVNAINELWEKSPQ